MKKLIATITTLLSIIVLTTPVSADFDTYLDTYLTPSSTFQTVDEFMRTYDGGNDYTTGGYSPGTPSTADTPPSTTSEEPDWSTYTEPHNYGIEGLEIPTGAIGVMNSSNAGLICLEADYMMWTMGLKSVADGETDIYDTEDKKVGKITIIDGGPEEKNYQIDYGYIYPEIMFVGGVSIDEGCIPSWYHTAFDIEIPEYVWDPNIDITESSTETSEAISCTENYERRIEIKHGTVYDAENGENLYYHDIASFNGTTGVIAYPWTGAVVGRLDEDSETTGFVCVQTKKYLTSLEENTDTGDADSSPAEDSTALIDPWAPIFTESNYPRLAERSYFLNIPDGEWYTLPYLELAERGIIEKTEMADIARDITRGELAEIIIKASGMEILTDFDSVFTDISESHPQAKYIYTGLGPLWNGKTSTYFDAEGFLVRAELAKILVNAEELADADMSDAKGFVDVSSDYWGYGWILRAQKYGIMTGVGDKTHFSPLGTLKVGEIVKAIHNTYFSGS